MPQKHYGSCLCASVTFRVDGDLRPVIACHCSQCRKTSGHFWAATQVNDDQITILPTKNLVWYRSSENAKRGFCNLCGSSLFWRMDGEGKTSIGAGSLDGATGLHIRKHIFTSDIGDYYSVDHTGCEPQD